MLEVVRGRNSKGNWPAKAAAKLRHVSATISLPSRAATERFMASETAKCKALRFTRYGPNMLWLEGVLGGTDELSRMLERILPESEIEDIRVMPISPSGTLFEPTADLFPEAAIATL